MELLESKVDRKEKHHHHEETREIDQEFTEQEEIMNK